MSCHFRGRAAIAARDAGDSSPLAVARQDESLRSRPSPAPPHSLRSQGGEQQGSSPSVPRGEMHIEGLSASLLNSAPSAVKQIVART